MSDLDTLDLHAGNWLFKQSCEFERGVTLIDQLPPADRPEFAFAGRSNVGKSSLLNALTGHANLARVSNTPGRTQQLNFFRLPAEKRGAYLVDLPGYGYAKAPKKDARRWTGLMMAYLQGRATLKRVFLLIDARHGLKSTDEPYMKAFDESAVGYQVVLTKTDKLNSGEIEQVRESTVASLKTHVAAHPRIISTSSVSGEGLDELRAEIAALIDIARLGYKSRVAASSGVKS